MQRTTRTNAHDEPRPEHMDQMCWICVPKCCNHLDSCWLHHNHTPPLFSSVVPQTYAQLLNDDPPPPSPLYNSSLFSINHVSVINPQEIIRPSHTSVLSNVIFVPHFIPVLSWFTWFTTVLAKMSSWNAPSSSSPPVSQNLQDWMRELNYNTKAEPHELEETEQASTWAHACQCRFPFIPSNKPPI